MSNYRCNNNRYGVLHFASDAILTVLTCGFWLIRVYVREQRNQ